MKIASFHLALLFALTTHSAQAQNPQADLDLFCTNPEKFICGYSHSEFNTFFKKLDPEGSSDEAYIDATRAFESSLAKTQIQKDMAKLEKSSLRLIAAEMGVRPEGFTLYDFYRRLLNPNTSREENQRLLIHYAKNWIRQANAIVYNQTGEIPKSRQLMTKELNRAKKSVINFVTSRFDLFPFKIQKEVTTKLANMPLFTVYDFEENHDMVLDSETGVYSFQKNNARTVNPAAEKWLDMFLEGCAYPDREGVFNAFFARLADKSEGVVICPGFMEKAILEQHYQLESGIFFVLAHELGHSIQHYIDPTPVLQCVLDNSTAKELPGPYYGKESFKLKNTFSILKNGLSDFLMKHASEEAKMQLRINTLLPHAGEIVADQFGNIALAETLKETADLTKKLQMIRSAWEPLCSLTPFRDGVHPPSEYRITQIFRRNPLVSEAMNCTKTTPKPRYGCSLDGASKTKY